METDFISSENQMATVVVLTWNGRHHLETCLPSILAQTFTSFDLLVVDNGSEDGTEDYVRSNFPQVRFLRIEKNRGIPPAFNRATKQIHSKYLVWLNDDTEVAPGWLEKLVGFMERTPGAAAADSAVCYHGQRDVIWSAGADYTVFGKSSFRHQDRPLNQHCFDEEVFGAVGCAAIYRMSVFDEIGLLDESFFLSHEDVDWTFRARLRGYSIHTVHDALVYHKVSATTVAGSDLYVYYGQRNVHFVFLKNMPGALLFLYMPLHLLFIFLGIFYHIRIGRLRPFLRAKRAVLWALPNILRQRRDIQRSRTISATEIRRLIQIIPKHGAKKLFGKK